MGMRSGTTFKKRQKELARMEKQRDKAARRLQRKAEKLTGGPATEEDEFLDLLDPEGQLSDSESVEAAEASQAPKTQEPDSARASE